MSQPTLIVALDLDETADAVLDVALRHADAIGARAVLAHVVPDAALAFPEARLATADHPEGLEQPPLLVEGARERLEALAERCRDAGVSAVSVVSHGEPAAALLDLCDAWDAELLVMGTHGRRGLARMLLGSVAEAVLRRADLPVLVVRTGLVGP